MEFIGYDTALESGWLTRTTPKYTCQCSNVFTAEIRAVILLEVRDNPLCKGGGPKGSVTDLSQ